MEALGQGLMAIGKAVSGCVAAYAWVYIIGIGTKTFLIYTGKAKNDELKNWFNFGKRKDGNL